MKLQLREVPPNQAEAKVGSAIDSPPLSKGPVKGMAGLLAPARNIVGRVYEYIDGKPQWPKCTAQAHHLLGSVRHLPLNDDEVQVRIFVCVAASVGSKQQNTFRLRLLSEGLNRRLDLCWLDHEDDPALPNEALDRSASICSCRSRFFFGAGQPLKP